VDGIYEHHKVLFRHVGAVENPPVNDSLAVFILSFQFIKVDYKVSSVKGPGIVPAFRVKAVRHYAQDVFPNPQSRFNFIMMGDAATLRYAILNNHLLIGHEQFTCAALMERLQTDPDPL